jgi:hypothetical protein
MRGGIDSKEKGVLIAKERVLIAKEGVFIVALNK